MIKAPPWGAAGLSVDRRTNTLCMDVGYCGLRRVSFFGNRSLAMFTVVKYARCGKVDARKKYTAAQIETATDIGDYYGWPYPTPILGCGDVIPADYDPKAVYRFDGHYDDSYTLDDFRAELDAVVESFDGDLKAVVLGAVNGWNLWKNSNYKPAAKSTRKLSDDAKAGWIAVNKPAMVADLVGKPVSTWVKAYNKIHSENPA